MQNSLNGKKIAILATDGFEEIELVAPRDAFELAGATTHLISLKKDKIQGWNHDEKANTFEVDLTVAEVNLEDYDALLLPGGVMNPDTLRQDKKAVALVREFFNDGKTIAAICHGPQLLIEANVVKGRKLTSFPSLKTDLINAGAEWIDQEVVTDQGLVTSRTPNDLSAFIRKTTEEICEGEHTHRQPSTA
ncbi:MAG: type 1 glutamine amidotransferase domain-containing protein [Pseudomonadota bacterium]